MSNRDALGLRVVVSLWDIWRHRMNYKLFPTKFILHVIKPLPSKMKFRIGKFFLNGHTIKFLSTDSKVRCLKIVLYINCCLGLQVSCPCWSMCSHWRDRYWKRLPNQRILPESPWSSRSAPVLLENDKIFWCMSSTIFCFCRYWKLGVCYKIMSVRAWSVQWNLYGRVNCQDLTKSEQRTYT